jgi:hypothetical protein
VQFLVQKAWNSSQHIQNSAIDHLWILNYNRSRFNYLLFFIQKLSLKSGVMLCESCRVVHIETKKIDFVFFWLSTIFYEFYKTQQKA